jgi:hypothetical protein
MLSPETGNFFEIIFEQFATTTGDGCKWMWQKFETVQFKGDLIFEQLIILS